MDYPDTRSYALGKLHPQFVPQYALELETKVPEDFTITEKAPTRALVGAFNKEKALVGAFSVIVKSSCIFG